MDIDGLIPNGLDDIVRKNRSELCLEYVNWADLEHIQAPIQITNLVGIIEDAFIYKRIINAQEIVLEHLFLVGFLNSGSERNAYHTSILCNINSATNVVLTSAGSNYIVKNFTDAPHLNLLLHICSIAHRDGWGSYFGVPFIFY